MSDKKITLSGLTKGNSSSSNTFMSSFRFSPESESMEEIKPPSSSSNGKLAYHFFAKM